jgi:hypothetical protein
VVNFNLHLMKVSLYIFYFLLDFYLKHFFIRNLPRKWVCSISMWTFLFGSLHFRSSIFAHCLSLTGFYWLVNVSNFFWYSPFDLLGNICYLAALPLPGHHQEHHHPFPQFPQPLYWRYRTLYILYFFFTATDPSKNVIYFYLNFWIQSYGLTFWEGIEPNQIQHSRVRLLSFTWIASSRNSREWKLCLPHSDVQLISNIRTEEKAFLSYKFI